MYIVDDKDEFIKEYGNIARRIALRFDLEKYTDMDRADAEQQAMLFLWESTATFDSSKGASFSTYAYKYVYNRLLNYFDKKNALKCRSEQDKVVLDHLTDDDLNAYETVLAAPEGQETDIGYHLLRLDLELQLQNIKRKAMRSKNKKTLCHGIQILEGIMRGDSQEHIQGSLQLSATMYKQCLYRARILLRNSFYGTDSPCGYIADN